MPAKPIYHSVCVIQSTTVYVLEVDDLLLDSLLFLSSLASFALLAKSLAYSAASARDFSPALRLRERRCLFRCKRTGVMSRWIFGALNRWGFPSFCGRGRLMTYCLTSSSFVRLYSLRIFPTRLGPSRLGIELSVNPAEE